MNAPRFGDNARRFGYGRDALCLMACAAYALNRFWFAPQTAPGSFWRNHFDDLLLIPAALPLVLWLQRRLGWRAHDGAPTPGEVGLHLLVWTLIAEVLGPWWWQRGTADWRDALAYAAGAVVAVIVWRQKTPCENEGSFVNSALDGASKASPPNAAPVTGAECQGAAERGQSRLAQVTNQVN